MEKLHIRLENENLRPQLDWIIDNASSANFNYPPVIINHISSREFVNNFYFFFFLIRNFGNIPNCYGKIKEYNSALKDLTNIS